MCHTSTHAKHLCANLHAAKSANTSLFFQERTKVCRVCWTARYKTGAVRSVSSICLHTALPRDIYCYQYTPHAFCKDSILVHGSITRLSKMMCATEIGRARQRIYIFIIDQSQREKRRVKDVTGAAAAVRGAMGVVSHCRRFATILELPLVSLLGARNNRSRKQREPLEPELSRGGRR
jgi:hypothetical protein